MNKGFTLIEVLIVAAITGVISTFLVLNFSRTRVDLNQSANIFAADVRLAETKAISSSKYSNYNPCGYGIHYVSATQYIIYVGPNAATVDCTTLNRNYGIGDSVLQTKSFIDTNVQFKGVFDDIFFEPPDPKTYLNNVTGPSLSAFTISIGSVNGSCPQNCITVEVSAAGRVKVQ